MMRRRRLCARRAAMRRVSRPATSTCKPSASRVERARQQRGGGARWGDPAAQPTRCRGASCDGQSREDVIEQVRAAALGDRQEVVDLQKMGGGVAAP